MQIINVSIAEWYDEKNDLDSLVKDNKDIILYIDTRNVQLDDTVIMNNHSLVVTNIETDSSYVYPFITVRPCK